MKRALFFLLALLMLVSLISCSGTPSETETATEEAKKTEEKKETKEDKKEVTYAKVEDPLTWDKLNAIPIAKQGMTSDELRQICVDYFNLAMTFRYVPNESADYSVPLFNLERTLLEGKLYGGLPYMNSASGNLYRLMEFYDEETGILNMTVFKNNMKLLGNDCSLGSNWGWARVVNTAKLRQTRWMTHANGYLKLGSYEYDLTIEDFEGSGENGSQEPKTITRNNGEQVMFASYALMQKADGIVSNGHARMATENAFVAKNADGTINGKDSYLICSDQVTYSDSAKYLRTQSDGTQYYIAGGNNIKYSFAELYDDGYIPFTFAEFQGTDPIEDGAALLDYTGDTITPNAIKNATVNANYILVDVYIKILDPEGNVLLNFTKRASNLTTLSMGLDVSETYFQKHAESGTNTLEITARIGNGELLTAYKGTLVKD